MNAYPELFTETYDNCLSGGDLLIIGPKGRENLHRTDSTMQIVVGLKLFRNLNAFFDVRLFEINPMEHNPLFDGIDARDPRAAAELEITRNIVPLPAAEDLRPGDRIILPVVGEIMGRCVGLFINQPGPDPAMFLMKPSPTKYL